MPVYGSKYQCIVLFTRSGRDPQVPKTYYESSMIVHSIEEHPAPTDAEIKDALHGNICRCTGYISILNGVKTASEEMKNQQQAAEEDHE